MKSNCQITFQDGTQIEVTVQCEICSKAAHECFSEVFCCNPCLQRFKDVVLNKIQLENCRKIQNCDTTTAIGRSCIFCTYKKCLSVGMKPNDVFNSSVRNILSTKKCAKKGFLNLFSKHFVIYESYAKRKRSNVLNYEKYKSLMHSGISVFNTMILTCFRDHFVKMNQREKVDMFNSCYFVFRMLESAFVLQKRRSKPVIYFFNGDYINMKYLNKFFGKPKREANFGHTEFLLTTLQKEFIKIQPFSEYEFVALTALNILNAVPCEVKSDEVRTYKQHQTKVVRDELIEYLKDKAGDSVEGSVSRAVQLYDFLSILKNIVSKLKYYLRVLSCDVLCPSDYFTEILEDFFR